MTEPVTHAARRSALRACALASNLCGLGVAADKRASPGARCPRFLSAPAMDSVRLDTCAPRGLDSRDMPGTASPCIVERCPNAARRGGLCWSHAKRRQRHMPVFTELTKRLAPQEALLEAALRVADAPAEDDGEWTRAWAQLQHAAVRFVRAAG